MNISITLSRKADSVKISTKLNTPVFFLTSRSSKSLIIIARKKPEEKADNQHIERRTLLITLKTSHQHTKKQLSGDRNNRATRAGRHLYIGGTPLMLYCIKAVPCDKYACGDNR